MKNILINAANSNSAGGLSVVKNFLSQIIGNSDRDSKFILVTSNADIYKEYQCDNIRIIRLSKFLFLPIINVLTYRYVYCFIANRNDIDSVINFGDLIPFVNCRVVYYFDWAYALYDDVVIWSKMRKLDFFSRTIKKKLILKYLHRCDRIICQTSVIKKRISKFADINKVVVIPNAIPPNFMVNNDTYGDIDSSFCEKRKFLYLTRYYSHKNIEVLVDVAEVARKEGLNWLFVLTIDKKQDVAASVLLKDIKTRELEDMFLILGEVKYDSIYKLYNSVEFVIIPSLIESYSSSHIEALIAGKCIFSSDRDFAREVCQDNAYYFDPLDFNNIVNAIKSGISEYDSTDKNKKFSYVNNVPSWVDSYKEIKGVLDGK
ncbi:glycosyltransferase [Vibrio splendidus]